MFMCEWLSCFVTAGPDSWLVRPSDTTEGDFAIFFYCNTAVQRFRIHKSGHQYSMGGRQFDRFVCVMHMCMFIHAGALVETCFCCER